MFIRHDKFSKTVIVATVFPYSHLATMGNRQKVQSQTKHRIIKRTRHQHALAAASLAMLALATGAQTMSDVYPT